jgi:hypothetical protein
MGARQVCGIEPARFLALEYLRPDLPPDPVVDVVAGQRRGDQHGDQHRDIHVACGGERAADEQQRIPGQERPDHDAGLDEHDQEQDRVDAGLVLRDQRLQVHVEVHRDVEQRDEKGPQRVKQFHHRKL